ncbi:carbohydrate ABC transporter permease [Anaerocolumna chitinilytica]|uniref:Sugar ABC transporter permease n=1 Tax=Anaerocolumna chitinilytica TaxID=1727145 RepID=A0A7I8DXF8_9FIRM|nr:carbohydrate ABC transporter permease [Anaerocolumna chitinilytica]BCK00957.1 sugar ABC transporter permease [Anaerocolumna chitinilytica]
MKTLRLTVKTTGLFLLALVVWIPIIMIVNGSFMGSDELSRNTGPILRDTAAMADWSFLPLYPTLKSYVELLFDSPGFFVMFWNSCLQVIPSLLGQLLTALPAAWAFARFDFKGKKLLFTMYILLMILPFQVTMVSSYLVLFKLHLTGTPLAIILPNLFSAFPVFIMVKFFRDIPKSLIEAAKLDGAGEGYIFFKIGIPLGSSGIFSALLLDFLEYWNAVEQPLTFLSQKKNLWPLSLYLPAISAENAGIAFTASVVTMALSLLLFLYGQRYLEQGIAASGLKG